jgi:hypothetical protein
MSDAVVFKTRIDTWLFIVLMCAVVACLYAAAEIVPRVDDIGVIVAGVIIGALAIGAALPLWVVLTTRYRLGDDALDIRCGPFAWIVPIKDITDIAPSRSILSSPALSLDRLCISYGNGRAILISPEPRAQFLRSLEARRAA